MKQVKDLQIGDKVYKVDDFAHLMILTVNNIIPTRYNEYEVLFNGPNLSVKAPQCNSCILEEYYTIFLTKEDAIKHLEKIKDICEFGILRIKRDNKYGK